MSKVQAADKQILIITKFRFIGDTLVAIPFFRAVREQWPSARIVLLTGPNARQLLYNNPLLDEVIEFAPTGRDRGNVSFIKLVNKLRGMKFDICLCLNRSFQSALIPWLCGIPIRSGFLAERRSFLLTHKVPYTYESDRSEAACYMDVLQAIAPLATFCPHTELWINTDEISRARSRLYTAFSCDLNELIIVGIQPGATTPAKRSDKRWQSNNFAVVADSLLAMDSNVRVVLLGGPDEAETSLEMRQAMSSKGLDRVADFIGKLDLRDSLSTLSLMNLFIGNDTAIMHSSIALKIPTIALFGPTNSKKWGTRRDDTAIIESPDNSMLSIEIADVLEASKAMLKSKRANCDPAKAKVY